MYIKIFAPGYYARQDTKTPVNIAIKAMIANMAFNLMLAPFLGYIGLALATALSATLNASLLYLGLKKLGVFSFSRSTLLFLAKVLFSSGVMFTVVLWYSPSFEVWVEYSFMAKVAELTIAILLGAITYFLSVVILGVRMRDLKAH